MTDTDRAWAWTALLLGIHQSEEVALSIAAWLSDVGTTGIGWFDEHIRTNPLAGTNPAARAGVVAGQGVALWVVYRLTRDSRTLTRWGHQCSGAQLGGSLLHASGHVSPHPLVHAGHGDVDHPRNPRGHLGVAQDP